MDLTGATWRKSSYSGSNGAHSIEVATVWRKSSYSGSNGADCIGVAAGWQKSSYSGDCIEVAQSSPGAVAVRDSKDPDGPKLLFTAAEWREFAARVKSGAAR
jgi:hypothetical protein